MKHTEDRIRELEARVKELEEKIALAQYPMYQYYPPRFDEDPMKVTCKPGNVYDYFWTSPDTTEVAVTCKPGYIHCPDNTDYDEKVQVVRAVK